MRATKILLNVLIALAFFVALGAFLGGFVNGASAQESHRINLSDQSDSAPARGHYNPIGLAPSDGLDERFVKPLELPSAR